MRHVRREINKESAPARKLREFVFRNRVFTDEAIILTFQYSSIPIVSEAN